MAHLSDTEVYKRVNTQLSIVRRMDGTEKYKAQLDALDEENKQARLSALSGGCYIIELHRAMVQENIQLIFEEISSLTAQQFNENRVVLNVEIHNKQIKKCTDCGGLFHTDCNTAELVCAKCGRVETIDGEAFCHEQLCNDRNMHRRGHNKPIYNFKNCLDNILGNNPLSKLGKDNGEKVVSELKQKIKDYGWPLESLTTDKIRRLLNISNRKYLCKFSTLLLHILKGKPIIPLFS